MFGLNSDREFHETAIFSGATFVWECRVSVPDEIEVCESAISCDGRPFILREARARDRDQ
jgi:hypothetical protein